MSNRPVLTLCPAIVNTRPSELADASTFGKPDGLDDGEMYAKWVLVNHAQKHFVIAYLDRRDERLRRQGYVDATVKVADALSWCCCPSQKVLVRWLDRLCRPFGSDRQATRGLWGQPDPEAPKQEQRRPVIRAYDISGRTLWYRTDIYYIVLPNDDRCEMDLPPWVDLLGQPEAWSKFMRVKAEQMGFRHRPGRQRRGR